MSSTKREISLIGREAELARVRAALLGYRPLLIVGAPGSGKSRLISDACEGIAARNSICVRFDPHPHDLFAKIARALLDSGHAALQERLRGRDNRIRRETSVHLRGVLWNSLLKEPRTLIVEDVERASAPIYRFLQPIYFHSGAALLITAVSADRIGYLHKLFWDRRDHLHLGPLRQDEAFQLASAAADNFGVPDEIDREELRKRIVESAGGNPGRIIEMYKLVSDPKYRSGSYVKLALIQIDIAARFSC